MSAFCASARLGRSLALCLSGRNRSPISLALSSKIGDLRESSGRCAGSPHRCWLRYVCGWRREVCGASQMFVCAMDVLEARARSYGATFMRSYRPSAPQGQHGGIGDGLALVALSWAARPGPHKTQRAKVQPTPQQGRYGSKRELSEFRNTSQLRSGERPSPMWLADIDRQFAYLALKLTSRTASRSWRA